MQTNSGGGHRRAPLGRATAWALIVLTGLGCAALDRSSRNEFTDTQKRFTQYVRWGKIAEASEFVAPELREEFLALEAEFRDMRFTDYEIIAVDIADDIQSARVDVRYSAYRLSNPVERTVDMKQEWERDAEAGHWQVRPELHPLRALLQGQAP